jgi:MFS family permease
VTARFGGIYYGWVLVAMLGVTQTVTWGLVYYSFSVFLPAMGSDLGWSRGEMAGALSLATLVSALCATPVGRWLDTHGARVLMTGGAVAATGLLLAWSRVETVTQFYVVWALIGAVMAGVLYEPAIAVITVWFERNRTRALTAMTLIAGFASTIFMPIESWLIDRYGWRPALVLMAIVLAATTVLPHALLLRRRPEDLGLSPDGLPPAPDKPSTHAKPSRMSVGQALRDSAFRWLALAFSLNMVVNIAVSVHLIAYLQDRGYDLGLAATATGLIGAMQVLGRLVLGLLGERVPLRVTAAVVLAIQPLSLVVLLVLPTGVGVWAFVSLFGAARGVAGLVRPSFVASLYGRERFASISGAMSTFVTGSTAVAPIGAGVAYDRLGSYDPLFWSFVLLSSAAAAVVLLVRESTPQTEPAPPRPEHPMRASDRAR